jgi:hypothetical protein
MGGAYVPAMFVESIIVMKGTIFSPAASGEGRTGEIVKAE